MDDKVIIAIISANADKPELIKLCAALLSTKDNKSACALKYYLLANNIAAEDFHTKYHSLCYEINGEFKEWKNEKGELHCTQVDENGNVLPAKTTNNSQSWWKDGKRFSPGVDENGYSLPHVIVANVKYWMDGNKYHRHEFAEDGTLMPACILPNGDKKWWFEGVQYTKEEIDKKFPPKNQDKVIELKGRNIKTMTIAADLKTFNVEYDDNATSYDLVMSNVNFVDFGEDKLNVSFKTNETLEVGIEGLKLQRFALREGVATITIAH